MEALDDSVVGVQVGHEGVMLLQEGLSRVLVLAVVRVRGDWLLLLHPGLGLVGVGEILLGLQGVLQVLLPLARLVLGGGGIDWMYNGYQLLLV